MTGRVLSLFRTYWLPLMCNNLIDRVYDRATTSILSVQGLNAVAQIAAFGSILCSLSSVLCGMLLIFNHRGRVESTGRTAVFSFQVSQTGVS